MLMLKQQQNKFLSSGQQTAELKKKRIESFKILFVDKISKPADKPSSNNNK